VHREWATAAGERGLGWLSRENRVTGERHAWNTYIDDQLAELMGSGGRFGRFAIPYCDRSTRQLQGVNVRRPQTDTLPPI
jgi:hypothetical protein